MTELRLQGEAPAQEGADAAGQRRWWRPAWLEEFERWAAPEVDPELAEEQERSFLPVGVLLGLALAGQVAQFSIPEIREFLREGNISQRLSWIGFTILKQWALFVLMLLALRIKEERLESVGFPAMDFRRLLIAFGLVGFSLGLALLHQPETVYYWMVPYGAGERVLYVLMGVTAAVVEETFFRGFAVVWLYRWSGHLPLAVGFPAVLFAAGHAYLGFLNLLFAFAAAVGFSFLFLWRRDLYWPMVIHYAINESALLV